VPSYEIPESEERRKETGETVTSRRAPTVEEVVVSLDYFLR
jgi:hypothetical protein